MRQIGVLANYGKSTHSGLDPLYGSINYAQFFKEGVTVMNLKLMNLIVGVFAASQMFVSPVYSADETETPEAEVSAESIIEAAEDEASLDSLSNRELNWPQCQYYSNNPWECNRIPGCQFSRIYGQCVSSGGPVQPVPNYCARFNYNYSQCVQSGCNFDNRTGGCYGGGGHPQPQPNYCSRFNYDQWQCQQGGCFYNQQNGMCFGGGGVPNPPQQSWVCTAVDSGWEEHGGGHAGYAYNQVVAQRQALASCQRHHGSCRIRECRQQ